MWLSTRKTLTGLGSLKRGREGEKGGGMELERGRYRERGSRDREFSHSGVQYSFYRLLMTV